jgi:beta-glucosidase
MTGVTLNATDAAGLTEMLQFLADWLRRDPDRLRASLEDFERTVTLAKPATVMCAYNKVNGVYAAHNRWLLTEVLREEWGFTGAVVSDWGGVHDPVAALAAGLDLEMPGTVGQRHRTGAARRRSREHQPR